MEIIRSGQHGVVDMGSMMNPEPVFVALVEHAHGFSPVSVSVRSTEAGPQRRIIEVMRSWGFPPDYQWDGWVRPFSVEVPLQIAR
ncbi:hypothetical protein P3H80_18920 [Mycolicibacterium septicum]|nr:hypothetical protein [Mycolicibacterium septicum]